MYIVAIVPGFFAVNDPSQQNARAAFHPPQALHFIDTQPDGSWSLRPYIHPYTLKRDPQTLAANFVADNDRKVYLKMFAEGFEYSVLGLFSDEHPPASRRRSRASRCSSSAPTASAAASTAASCRARRSRSPSASSACCCR